MNEAGRATMPHGGHRKNGFLVSTLGHVLRQGHGIFVFALDALGETEDLVADEAVDAVAAPNAPEGDVHDEHNTDRAVILRRQDDEEESNDDMGMAGALTLRPHDGGASQVVALEPRILAPPFVRIMSTGYKIIAVMMWIALMLIAGVNLWRMAGSRSTPQFIVNGIDDGVAGLIPRDWLVTAFTREKGMTTIDANANPVATIEVRANATTKGYSLPMAIRLKVTVDAIIPGPSIPPQNYISSADNYHSASPSMKPAEDSLSEEDNEDGRRRGRIQRVFIAIDKWRSTHRLVGQDIMEGPWVD